MTIGRPRLDSASGPVLLLELELDGRTPVPADWPETPGAYPRARVLVRLHTVPLGAVDVSLEGPALDAAVVAELASHELRDAIDAHLAREGPACERERSAFRAVAPPASVVVATRDRPARLVAALESLFALDYPDYEVVVVDNAAMPTSRSIVESRLGARPKLVYVHEPRPGLALAHNRGLDEARGEIIAFTDDDVVVDRLWLLELARAFGWARGVVCVTGLIWPAELETPAQIWLDEHVHLNKGYEPRLFDTRSNRPDDPLFPYAVGALGSGANMAFRADALRAVGGFDPATGAGTSARGGDDLAAFFAVLAEGGTVAYQPAAVVRHFYRRDVDGLRRQMFDYGVGLGAYLTKLVLDRPSNLGRLGRRVPIGIAHALGMRSARNGAADRSALGVELARLERRGVFAGPPAYLFERVRRRSLYDKRDEERRSLTACG